jgi:SlyX protein
MLLKYSAAKLTVGCQQLQLAIDVTFDPDSQPARSALAMPHTQASPPHTHDALQEALERLNELEIKASFTEDLIDKLDQVVIRQQTQINALISEVLHLRQQASDPQAAAQRNLRDELPPHY